MNINVERFLALTAMLAAPLVAAPGCIINSDDDDDGGSSNSQSSTAGTEDTGSTTNSTTNTTPGESTGTLDTTASDTTAGDTTAGDTTAGDTTAGETGTDLGNCCVADHGVGCENTEVQDCVCAEDPICCEEGWDMFCVNEVNQFGCGTCELAPMPWDCVCTTDCDGAPVDTFWQVCGGDEVEAGTAGQLACEADLEMMGCMAFTCSDCVCATAEIPEIEC